MCGRKVGLLVDYAPCCRPLELSNERLPFLPHYKTSHFQAVDVGGIKTFTLRYWC